MRTALALAIGIVIGLATAEEFDFYWAAYIGPCRTDTECSYHCPPDDDCDGGPQ